MKNLLLFFFLIFSTNTAFSQEWEVIPYEDITDESLRIISLFEDNEGNVWGGNSFAGRVIRWNGNTWEAINNDVTLMDFESPSVYSIFQDSNDRVLFCSGDGIGVYENDTWSNINTSNADLTYNFAFDGIEHNGVLWFTSRASLVSLDGTTWTTYEIPDANWNALGLAAMDDGRIFVTIANGDPIRRFDNGNWEVFGTDNSSVSSNYQYYVGKVDGETFWFGGPSGNGSLYENGEFTPSSALSNWGMGTDYFTEIAVDGAKDNVWFGSGYGLHHLDGDNWETFDAGNSPMTSSEVLSLMIAQDGKIWFTTENEILIYTPLSTSTTSENLLSSSIKLMPNPATEFLQLDINRLDGTTSQAAQIQIFDFNGKLVLTQQTAGQSSLNLDISHLPTGNYTLDYMDGKSTTTKRFIKQ